MRNLFALLALALVPAIATPCSLVIHRHEIDPAEQARDEHPPDRVVAELHSVHRGKGPRQAENGQITMTSCDDVGRVTLTVTDPPDDDRTAAADLGYVVRHASGALPSDLMPLNEPVRIADDGLLHLHWLDGATDDQETIDFTITVSAVDLAGNEGTPSAEIRVRDQPGNRAPTTPRL